MIKLINDRHIKYYKKNLGNIIKETIKKWSRFEISEICNKVRKNLFVFCRYWNCIIFEWSTNL